MNIATGVNQLDSLATNTRRTDREIRNMVPQAHNTLWFRCPEDVHSDGRYFYETAGSIHTLQTQNGAKRYMDACSADIKFERDGSFLNIKYAAWIDEMMDAAAKAIDQTMARYFRASGIARNTD